MSIRYEAGVAGGIPCIKALSEGLAGNEISRVMGVMNGTCNYILTRMQSAGLDYQTVFAECEELGYLEADPTLDVGGIDAGHKLAHIGLACLWDAGGFRRASDRGDREDHHRGYRAGRRYGLPDQAVGRGPEDRARDRRAHVALPCPRKLAPWAVGRPDEHDRAGRRQRGPDRSARCRCRRRPNRQRGAGRHLRSGAGRETAGLWRACDHACHGRSAPTAPRPPLITCAWNWPTSRVRWPRSPPFLAMQGISIDRMRQYGHEASTAPVLFVTHKASHA